MPFLDVSDIVLDPDFVTLDLSCARNTQTVGESGLAANAVETIDFSGVVTSDKGDVLERGAAGERVTGSILIHSRCKLQDGGAGFAADIVTWNGRRYTVVKVNNYSTYGRGFYAATCDLIPLSG